MLKNFKVGVSLINAMPNMTILVASKFSLEINTFKINKINVVDTDTYTNCAVAETLVTLTEFS